MSEVVRASAPHRNGDGTFRNPWPDERPQHLRSFLRWRRERWTRGAPKDPDPAVFEQVAPSFRVPRAAVDELTVTWIGHSASLLQIGGRNVLTDPMLGERASPISFIGPRRWVPPGVPLQALPPIDAVLLSHNHYDHLDVGSVRGLAYRFPGAAWVVPVGAARVVRSGGAMDVRELDWWEESVLDGLRVTATPARHFSARSPWDRNRSLWCGFAIEAPLDSDRRVLFAGDSGYHPEFRRIGAELGPFDLSLVPIGAYEPRWFMRPVHMNPEEAVQTFRDLGGDDGGVMMGIHWGTFKLTDEPMDEPPKRTRSAWAAAGLPPERLWVPRHGETLVLDGTRVGG